MSNHDRHSQNHWPPALPSDRINPRRERSRLFREIFKAPFMSGFLPLRLVDSGAIVTFETDHPAIAPQRVKAARAALSSGDMPAGTPRVAKWR